MTVFRKNYLTVMLKTKMFLIMRFKKFDGIKIHRSKFSNLR
jgi:hypothetical protein